jgi:hypothetical protein
MQIGSIGKHFMDINRESQHKENDPSPKESKNSRVKRKPFTASNFMKINGTAIKCSKGLVYAPPKSNLGSTA